MTTQARRLPIILWPLAGLWKVVTFFANAVGILITLTLGFVFMVLGFFLTSTIIGAVIGVPLFLAGLLLFIRGLY
ncbi:MAG: hypothetical protein GC168_15465 [Candidatus Hydrogenedens sp.]|nr:hypothetical protein [Candidatus Hydrogenedens sp.]